MKNTIFVRGKNICCILLVAILFLPNTLAAEECQDNDQICLCSQAWSRGFDAVHKQVVSDVVAPALSQNNVAGSDMFSAERAINLVYACDMMNICLAAKLGGRELDMHSLSVSNENGGAVPGVFAGCTTDQTVEKHLQKLSEYDDIRADIEKNCTFSSPERLDQVELMYRSCVVHAKMTIHAFSYTLRNMLWRDNNRKVSGFFYKKVYDFLEKLKELQTEINAFVQDVNGAYGQICATR